MRLTPELIASAPQSLNCVGARELTLRGLALPAVENLATAHDAFDTIDLSANAIETLDPACFPRFPRLSALYLGANRIRAIYAGFADALPNLRTLVLTDNRIQSLEQLNIDELKQFTRLEVLCLSGNPVAKSAGLRLLLIQSIPSLRFLNFRRVTRQEKLLAVDKHGLADASTEQNISVKGKRQQKKHPNSPHDAPKTFTVGSVRDDGSGSTTQENPHTNVADRDAQKNQNLNAQLLTKENIDKIKAAILAATSIEQVHALQTALQSGDFSTVPDLFNESNANTDD